jgi:hypothetical protein
MAGNPGLVAPSCPTQLLSGLGPDSFLVIAQKQYRLRPDTRTQSVAARKGGLWGGAPTEIYKEIRFFFKCVPFFIEDNYGISLCAFRVVQKRKGEERVGVGGQGKYPGAPPYHQRKKREKSVDRKVPDRPIW